MNTNLKKLALGTISALLLAGSAYAWTCQSDCHMQCKAAFPNDPAAQSSCYEACVLGCSDSGGAGGN